MPNLANVPKTSRDPVATERGITDSTPTAFADSVRRVTDATTDNSVEDSLSTIEANEKTQSSRIDHLQAVVDALNTGSRYAWEPPTLLDYDSGFRVSHIEAQGWTYVDPRQPQVASRNGNTSIRAEVPRGFDPQLMRMAVTRGNAVTSYPGDGQEWNQVTAPGTRFLDTYELQNDSGGTAVSISVQTGDSFQFQIARVAHELEIPLEALEQGLAGDGDLMTYLADANGWRAAPGIAASLISSFSQSRWRSTWAPGAFIDKDLCKYQSKYYLRAGSGTDSASQNPTANAHWHELAATGENVLDYWLAVRMDAIASIGEADTGLSRYVTLPADGALASRVPVYLLLDNNSPVVKGIDAAEIASGRPILGTASQQGAADGADVSIQRYGRGPGDFPANSLSAGDVGKPVYLRSATHPWWTTDISESADGGRIHGVIEQLEPSDGALVIWDFVAARTPDPAPWARAGQPEPGDADIGTSASVAYDNEHRYAYLRSDNPGTLWGTPAEVPRDGAARPIHWREIGSDDTRTLPAGNYFYTFRDQRDGGFVLSSGNPNSQALDNMGPTDSAGNPQGYDASAPGFIFSSGLHRFYFNEIGFTIANAGTTIRDLLFDFEIQIRPAEWRTGDLLTLTIETTGGGLSQHVFTWSPQTGDDQDIFGAEITYRLPDGLTSQNSQFYLRLQLDAADQRAQTSRHIEAVDMTVAAPHKGTYAIQGLRVTDSLPDAPVSMGANRPSGGATLTPVVRGDDNTAALFLNLYREQEPPPNSEHDWHYLEATADMRKVTLKIWASQNPTYTTGRIQVWTWLPGVLAAKKIGERALSDYRTEGNAIRVLVGAVLKGQRFLIFATDAPTSLTGFATAIGAPFISWDVNPSGEPAYQTVIPGLLKIQRVLASENAAQAGPRIIAKSDLPGVPTRLWERIWVAIDDGNNPYVSLGHIDWQGDLLEEFPAAETDATFITRGAFMSGFLVASDQGFISLRAGIKANGDLAVEFHQNRQCRGIWIEFRA